MRKIIVFTSLIAVLITVLVSATLAAPENGGDYDLFRASVGNGEVEGNGSSFHAFGSYDGRYVAFESYATNWVYDGPASQPNYSDIFLRDTQTDVTKKLTLGTAGEAATDKSFFPSMSHDGRYIAYLSYAPNLVFGDTNGVNPWVVDGLDIFVYDQMTGTNKRVSLNYQGNQITGNSEGIISPDGKLIIFASDGINVMPDSSINGVTHLYIRDWQSGAMVRVSNTIDGIEPEGIIHQITVSYDAQYIVFSSNNHNLVPNDTNDAQDIFLYNRQTGTIKLVSKSLAGFSGNGVSGRPQISPGGEFITFTSFATDLVPGDTNNFEDVFLFEIATGSISRISVTSNGMQANGDNKEPTICEEGRFIAWKSAANNYTPLDINSYRDIYFYDTVQDELRLVSMDLNGFSPNGAAHRAWLSPDCRYIVFASEANNMITGDNNNERDLYMGRLIWPFDLSRSNLGGPAFADPGEEITYKVWVRNHGLETDTASFVAGIPDNTTFVSGSGTNGAVYNSALNQVQWNGSVMGESEIEISFKVFVNPGLTEPTFLELQTQLTGDSIGYTYEHVTIVNGFYTLLPTVLKD